MVDSSTPFLVKGGNNRSGITEEQTRMPLLGIINGKTECIILVFIFVVVIFVFLKYCPFLDILFLLVGVVHFLVCSVSLHMWHSSLIGYLVLYVKIHLAEIFELACNN